MSMKRRHSPNLHIPYALLQVLRKALTGDTFGETGVLCYKPQPFTVRTTELSQILRLNITPLMNTIQANTEDGHIVMKNFFLVCKIIGNFPVDR